MEIKRDFWFPGSEGEEARTMYVTGTDGVSKEVVERFAHEWKKDASEVMALQVKGRADTFESSYDKKNYAVSRPAEYALSVTPGFASQ